MKKSFLVLICYSMINFASSGIAASIVKKSSSGICHDKNSQYYAKTKNYKSFKTMKDCLDSGGRLPKR